MINQWRKVEYTDDGCTVYECLKCKAGWESRSDPEWGKWQFCPCCGTKWDGQLKWDENAKYEKHRLRNSAKQVQVFPNWIVEERYTDPMWNDEGPLWERATELKNYPAVQAHAALKSHRQWHSRTRHKNDKQPWTHEFRLRLL